MIASLPMYDRAETRAANDRLWSLIRSRYDGPAPQTLTRTGAPETHWRDPSLVLSQTCGLPYRTALHREVALAGTPVLDLDVPPGHYRSEIVVRADDPREAIAGFAGATLAVNAPDSQSGAAAPMLFAAENGVAFGRAVLTGAHAASARAVAEGRADIAAIDALSWRMLRRWERWTDALRVLARTSPTPALPYITRAGDPDALYAALEAAVAALAPDDRDTLGLRGIVRVAPEAYLAVPPPLPLPQS